LKRADSQEKIIPVKMQRGSGCSRMKPFYDFFLRPYWMELLGLGFLAVSIFIAGQWIVDVGFSLLIAGTLVNGFSNLKEHYQSWRRRASGPRG
jgi:hypothetical protein